MNDGDKDDGVIYYHPHFYFVNDQGRFIFDIDLELTDEDDFIPEDDKKIPRRDE